MRYGILDNGHSLSNNFTINPVTGEIKLTSPLDFELLDPIHHGKISLNVTAFDGATPPLSSFVLVNITVEVKKFFENVTIMYNNDVDTFFV